MRRGQVVTILTMFVLLFGAAIPSVAADEQKITDNASIYYNAAELALGNGDYKTAISLYDNALASNTTLIRLTDALLYTYRDKGYAQIQLGNYTEAIVTLNAGIGEYPNDQMLWNNKGYAQYQLGQYSDAVTSYTKAIAIDANYTKALINKGDALSRLGNYQEAVNSYKAALASDPGNTVATTKLADAEKATADAQSQTMIVLVIVVIVAVIGVVYYVTRKSAGAQKAVDGKTKKEGKKKK